MKYSVVYSSKTGNTKLLADQIKKTLDGECVYFGEADKEALKAERIYVGFWTDKGTCDSDTAKFLETLTTQEIFLFGTAGFGENDEYFDQIIGRIQKKLASTVKVTGSYMCQGKMPVSVRERYEKMSSMPGMKKKMDDMIRNFDRALSHPDKEDLEKLSARIK